MSCEKLDTRLIGKLFFSYKYNQFIYECCHVCLSLSEGDSKRINYNDSLFVVAINSTTGKRSNYTFESHKKYIDIHLVLKGREILEVINISNCALPYKFDANDDYYLYDEVLVEKIRKIVLNPGDIEPILFDDVHKTNIAVGDISENISKLVIKVSKELFDREFCYGK